MEGSVNSERHKQHFHNKGEAENAILFSSLSKVQYKN